MQQYRDLLTKVLLDGLISDDRTGTGTTRIFAEKMVFRDVEHNFPLITSKFVSIKMIAHELLWFISGNTNTKYLTDNGVNIWNEWANSDGDLGPIYGAQWRNYGGTFRYKQGNTTTQDGIDQLANAIQLIKTDPTSRRIIVDSWSVSQLPSSKLGFADNVAIDLMALAPCHMMFQFFVRGSVLDIFVHQRSADMFLGVPYNIASYALLLKMVAQVTGKRAGTLTWSGGDCHVYNNHLEQCRLLLSRDIYKLPILNLNTSIDSIDDFSIEDIGLYNYKSGTAIKGEISI